MGAVAPTNWGGCLGETPSKQKKARLDTPRADLCLEHSLRFKASGGPWEVSVR